MEGTKGLKISEVILGGSDLICGEAATKDSGTGSRNSATGRAEGLDKEAAGSRLQLAYHHP